MYFSGTNGHLPTLRAGAVRTVGFEEKKCLLKELKTNQF
jgi:hypothetical protein